MDLLILRMYKYLGCIDWEKRYVLAMAAAAILFLTFRFSNAWICVLYHRMKSLLALFYNTILFTLSDVEARSNGRIACTPRRPYTRAAQKWQ